MFGLKRKTNSDIQLDPEKISRLSQQELYLFFKDENWIKLDPASRLMLLQEIENRRAKLDGRPAIRIEAGSREEFEKPGSLGYYNDGKRVIRVNYRFLEGKSPYHMGFAALDVVLHEGRHAMQHDVIRENPDKVAVQILMEWLSSTAHYFAPPKADLPQDEAIKAFVCYAMQSIEVDARRFSRQQLLTIYAEWSDQGMDTRALQRQIMSNLKEEYAFILLLQNALTLKELDALEQMVLRRMKERYPKVDTANLHLFDHARMILEAPRINQIENPIELILALDVLEQRKLDRLDDSGDRLDDRSPDRTDRRLPGLAAGFKL